MSCLAFNQNEIIGLCLNKIAFKEPSKNIASFEDVVKDKDIFMNRILEFMDVLYENVDVFQDHDQVLILHMICVSEDFKGQGISSQMMKWSETQAKSRDITMLSAETTGIASAKIFQNADFQKVKELSYDDYQDKYGEKIFAHLDPHKSCIVWKKEIWFVNITRGSSKKKSPIHDSRNKSTSWTMKGTWILGGGLWSNRRWAKSSSTADIPMLENE